MDTDGLVYVLTILGANGEIEDQELFDGRPTFELEPNMRLRAGYINGGDTSPETSPGR